MHVPKEMVVFYATESPALDLAVFNSMAVRIRDSENLVVDQTRAVTMR